ncbi:unnamed protein product [Heterobilharzia americana]|nr:unnamed protein product [Heterobilharzia americana]
MSDRGYWGPPPRGRRSDSGRGGPRRGGRPSGNGYGDDRQFYDGPPPSAQRGRGWGGPPPPPTRGYAPPNRGQPPHQPRYSQSAEYPIQRIPSTVRSHRHSEAVFRKPMERTRLPPSSSEWTSHPPSEQGDVPLSSESEVSSEVARQKKSHPKVRPVCDLSDAVSKLGIQGIVRIPARPDEEAKANSVCRIDAKEGQKTEVRMPPKELRSLIQQVADSLPDTIIYDGGHAIYSEDPLPGITTDPVEKEIEIKDPLGRDRLLLKYRIMEVQKVSTSDVDHFIRSPKATSLNMPQESIGLLDCILKNVSKQSFVSLGRAALFYERPIKIVADKLFTIHKGFISSVRPQWKVRVNIDMTCKAFFTSGNLADVMFEKYGDNMVRCSSQMAYDLRRIRVETDKFYKSDSGNAYSRRFTIHGISSEPANRLIIENVKQSVAEYFEQHHHITLKYPELPCVKVDQKREVYMPMELLNILPYQAPNASKADVASEVIRCAAVRPQERFQELQTFANNMLKSHP